MYLIYNRSIDSLKGGEKVQQLVLGLIFLGLGIGLFRNQKAVKKRFEKAKVKSILSSKQKASSIYGLIQKGQLGLTMIIAIYLCLGYIRPMNETPVLILMLLFLGTYYGMYYMSNEEWFFDEQGLWTSHLSGHIGFENIVGYECRVYREMLIIRVKYKGRGIMINSCDLKVAEDQKEKVTAMLNKHMAGI